MKVISLVKFGDVSPQVVLESDPLGLINLQCH